MLSIQTLEIVIKSIWIRLELTIKNMLDLMTQSTQQKRKKKVSLFLPQFNIINLLSYTTKKYSPKFG